MTDKEFQELLNGKKVNWSSGKENVKKIKRTYGVKENPYRDESKKLIENQRKKKEK